MITTKTQEKQWAYLERVEERECRYGGGTLSTLDCLCRTCNVSVTLNSACGAQSFLLNHQGHRTWITDLGARRVSGY
jgi:hypothetical protein